MLVMLSEEIYIQCLMLKQPLFRSFTEMAVLAQNGQLGFLNTGQLTEKGQLTFSCFRFNKTFIQGLEQFTRQIQININDLVLAPLIPTQSRVLGIGSLNNGNSPSFSSTPALPSEYFWIVPLDALDLQVGPGHLLATPAL